MGSTTVEDFARWLDEYGDASRRGDPAASADLFTDDARYFESPFDEPLVGRDAICDYWAQGATAFTDKQPSYEILAVAGDRGIANWRSRFTVAASGERAALDCVFVVEFDEDGRCREFREWWHVRRPADD
jgi:ketosteroid isomerase-like protein